MVGYMCVPLVLLGWGALSTTGIRGEREGEIGEYIS